IEARPAILERAPDVCYAVAGTGPDRERLEKRAHELRLGDRVRFLGGVGDQDLPAFYNLASVYVGASRRAERLGVEGFGISLVEASACGLPWWQATRAACPMPCATARRACSFLPRSPRPSPMRSAVCWRTRRRPRAWDRTAAARWRPTSTGTGWYAI